MGDLCTAKAATAADGHRSATALKPLTADVSYIDHPITLLAVQTEGQDEEREVSTSPLKFQDSSLKYQVGL